MRIGWQIAEPFQIHQGMKRLEARKAAELLIQEVELPEPTIAFDKYPHQLSGGQKQRVMLAMALAGQPEVLIADEPTTALDVTVQQAILDLLFRLQRRRGLAVLFITHDLEVVRDIADTVVVLKAGRVVESGTVEHVLLSPQHAYTKALLQARNRPISTAKRGNHPVLIEARGVGKSFVTKRTWWGGTAAVFDAVSDATFSIHRGERVGLVGESGCGKSTLGRMMLGLTPVSGGSVTFNGELVLAENRPSMRVLRRKAQLVFQDPYSALNPQMRIGKALEEVLLLHGTIPNEAAETVNRLLLEVELDPAISERFPNSLSGGQRQRIVIARALAVNPEFLVLDESVAALDLQVQAAVLDLLKRIGTERQLTYLFISHDIGVVESFCNRLLVMEGGRIVEAGDIPEVIQHPQHPYTQKLLSSRPGKRPLKSSGSTTQSPASIS